MCVSRVFACFLLLSLLALAFGTGSPLSASAEQGTLEVDEEHHMESLWQDAEVLMEESSASSASAGAPLASGTSVVSGCSPAYGSWDASHRPPACWRPYSDDAPFNRLLPKNPPVHENSAGIVARTLGFGKWMNMGALAPSRDFTKAAHGIALYYSRPNAPQTTKATITCLYSKIWGKCEIEGAVVWVPNGAQPAALTDAHMTIIDQESGIEYDLWEVQNDGHIVDGKLVCSYGGMTSLDGDASGSGAVAAGWGSLAGVIRADEMMAGEINHALFLTVDCTNGNFVYPAEKDGQNCAQAGKSLDDAPAMGQHYFLDMSMPEIDALKVPAWKKVILRAMSRYGMFLGDTGGPGPSLQQDSQAQYRSMGVENAWVAVGKKYNVEYNDDPIYAGHVFRIHDDVDWAHKLKVVHPCVVTGDCAGTPADPNYTPPEVNYSPGPAGPPKRCPYGKKPNGACKPKPKKPTIRCKFGKTPGPNGKCRLKPVKKALPKRARK